MTAVGAAVRRLAVLGLDAAGLGLIIYAAWLWSAALGFLVAGVIALGVAVILTPATGGESDQDESGATDT